MFILRQPLFFGALNQSRTDDLILTMDALCLLSYEGAGRCLAYEVGTERLRYLIKTVLRRRCKTCGAGEGNRTLTISLGS